MRFFRFFNSTWLFFVLMVLLLTPEFTRALTSQLKFIPLDTEYELNSVRSIHKDQQNYMWFGSTEGLVKYNGADYVIYKHDTHDSSSISNNIVSAISEDVYGNLWIGTFDGLNLYKRHTDDFSRIEPFNNYLKNQLGEDIVFISDMLMYNDSILCIGTYAGLVFYNALNGTFEVFTHNETDPASISSNSITSLALDNNKNLWIGTEHGLNKFKDPEKEFLSFYKNTGNSGLSSNSIFSLCTDKFNNVWAGTKDAGLNKIYEKAGKFIIENNKNEPGIFPISTKHILSLHADNDGILWVGTENGGLNRLNILSGDLEIYKTIRGNNFSIVSNSIRSIFNDRQNRLWLGTFDRGICVIDGNVKQIESYTENPFTDGSISEKHIKGFTEDKNGNIWIASDGGGINIFNTAQNRVTKHIQNSNGNKVLANNNVQCILYDSNNNIWVGTWSGGIDRLSASGKHIKNYRLENDKSQVRNNIFTIYEDKNQNIWAATAGSGLFRHNSHSDEFELVRCPGAISETSYVTSILNGSDGKLWVGTRYGLALFDANDCLNCQCELFLPGNDESGISSYLINVIFEDSKNRIWIGTEEGGLNLYNKSNNSFTQFRMSDGLISNSIKGIVEDMQGYLWITSNRGISRFHYDFSSLRNFTKDDGFNSNDFSLRAAFKASNGKLYFGTKNGFNALQPSIISINPYPPKTVFTELRVNNKIAAIGGPESPLKKHISESKEIRLNHKQTSFSISFAALNYTQASLNQYKYMLEGFDTGWIENGNRRIASYTNIGPGKYTFKVLGSNNDGVWGETPALLQIKILPPVWKTWWAFTFYALLVLAGAVLALKLWNERMKIKHLLSLEQLALEKEQKLNEQNIRFFTNISHEFRTPLSLIIAPVESLLNSGKNTDGEQLQTIHRNALRLHNLTNNLMDLRKLESGMLKLNLQQADVLKFIKRISSYFISISKQRNIRFHIEARQHEIQAYFDAEKLETIIVNLLSNAFKYTPENGTIRLNVDSTDAGSLKNMTGFRPAHGNYVKIEVLDNGPGIPLNKLPHIFDKFYRINSAEIQKQAGTGLGLALVKALAEIHQGAVWAESRPRISTCFTYMFPQNIGAYTEYEINEEYVSCRQSVISQLPHEIEENESEIVTGHTNANIQSNTSGFSEILIVEDNAELRSFLVTELSCIYKVYQAENGLKGIEAALEYLPDLIISDVLMPGYSGLELCKTLKSDSRTSHIPIILLSAKSSVNDQIEGVETGADAYITKPFNLNLLSAQISRLIQTRNELYESFGRDMRILPSKFAKNKIDEELLQKAIDYINTHITDPDLNVEELAAQLNLSRSNLYRKIKALTGKPIVDFIRIVRLKQAIKLMNENQYTIAEIAYQTGFTSPSYFTKIFKANYGKTPSQFLEA